MSETFTTGQDHLRRWARLLRLIPADQTLSPEWQAMVYLMALSDRLTEVMERAGRYYGQVRWPNFKTLGLSTGEQTIFLLAHGAYNGDASPEVSEIWDLCESWFEAAVQGLRIRRYGLDAIDPETLRKLAEVQKEGAQHG